MEIPYASRSKFLAKCEETIKHRLTDLLNGIPLRIEFESGGYNNRIVATQKDPTRFPARIKAAATALHNCACFGRYEISHKNGVLVIRQI
jgi:hypothetical protein